MHEFSIWQLLVVFLILMLLFGTKKLKSMGSDLGSAIRDFKQAVSKSEATSDETAQKQEQITPKQ